MDMTALSFDWEERLARRLASRPCKDNRRKTLMLVRTGVAAGSYLPRLFTGWFVEPVPSPKITVQHPFGRRYPIIGPVQHPYQVTPSNDAFHTL
eukprot:952621-Prorocentrum_minimum.AAC.1